MKMFLSLYRCVEEYRALITPTAVIVGIEVPMIVCVPSMLFDTYPWEIFA